MYNAFKLNICMVKEIIFKLYAKHYVFFCSVTVFSSLIFDYTDKKNIKYLQTGLLEGYIQFQVSDWNVMKIKNKGIYIFIILGKSFFSDLFDD